MMRSPEQTLLNHALDWMREASRIAMQHYSSFDLETGVMHKSDDSPLTRADLEVDVFLRKKLRETFPDIPVVTEEQAATHQLNVSSGWFFLVDPIDGTKEFINKRDEFTVNVGLLKDQKPIAGVVAAPALGKCYIGAKEKGAQLINLETGDAMPISVSNPNNDALLVVASRSHLSDETQAFIDANMVAETRNAGSSLKFCLLAEGKADLYPRFGPTMEWDTAAGHAVLLAAGGFVNRIEGGELTYAKQEFRNPHFIAGAEGVKFSNG